MVKSYSSFSRRIKSLSKMNNDMKTDIKVSPDDEEANLITGMGMNVETILKKMEAEIKRPSFKRWVLDFTKKEEYCEECIREWSDKKDLEQAFDEYLKKRWSYFTKEFKSRIQTQNGKLVIYRAITVPDLSKFLSSIQAGESQRGLGIYWTWDKNKIQTVWGDSSHKYSLVIEGLIDEDSINIKETAIANVNPIVADAEAEIQLKKHSPVLIKQIKSKGKIVWSEEMEATASFKTLIFSKYRISAVTTKVGNFKIPQFRD